MADNMVIQVARGLLKDPMSKKWRDEYAKLSAKDREDVRDIIDAEAMGTGIPAKKFQNFWKYTEEVD